MKITSKINIRRIGIFAGIILAYTAFFQTTYSLMVYEKFWTIFTPLEILWSLFVNYIPILMVSLLIWCVCAWSVRLKQHGLKIGIDFCATLIIMTGINFIFMVISGMKVNWGGTLFNSILIWLGIEFYTVSQQKQKSLIREALLEKEYNLQKYELMQAYVNPHFLFNALDMLCSMVDSGEKETALGFIENLASYYRGMLRRRKVRRVPLEDELTTMKDYLAVVSRHYGSKLSVDIVNDMLTDHFCVPFSLQLLVENALKHNVITDEEPMRIIVVISKDSIMVSNPLRPKPIPVRRTNGLGLSYLHNMYGEFGQNVKVDMCGEEFKVTLPATI